MNVNIRDDCSIDVGELDSSRMDIEEPLSKESCTTFICKPLIGMKFDSIEESHEFWQKYGFNTGFGGRIKNTNMRKKDKVITSRTYVCTRAGKKYDDPRWVNSKHCSDTKCDCGVLMSISLYTKGKYYVREFVEDHNHDLERENTVHHLRAHRNINEIQARAIDIAKKAGMGTTLAHRYMAVEAGGVEKVGCTREDMKTHFCMLRTKNIELGEACAILKYFEQQSKDNPSFFHSIQLDSEGKITNFFWADSKMLVDYEAFGDMVSFDTTFGTNNASRSLGIFQILVECHGGKLPKIIFTDQDAAMKSALSKIMPDVLTENLDLFMSEFHHCMYSIDDIDDFEVNWREMAIKFGITENEWNPFTVGARSTQLSECINGRLKKDLGSGLTMESFFNGFDLFMARVKDIESKSDCFCRQTFSHLTNKYSRILKQAAETYTRNIFNLFQKESEFESVVRLDKNDLTDYPHVRFAKVGNKSYNINFDPTSMTVSCSCGSYEMQGYLCAHILRVFNVCGVDKIPEKYIMKRWTIHAKSYHKQVVNPDPKLTIAQKYDILSINVRRILHRVFDDEIFEGVRHIINNTAHSFIDKYKILKQKGKENINSTSVEFVRMGVIGLKKNDKPKGGGKHRMVAWTEGEPKTKKLRAKQQKRLSSQSIVVAAQSSLEIIQELVDGDDHLLPLTLG